jgi:hypothetical protein
MKSIPERLRCGSRQNFPEGFIGAAYEGAFAAILFFMA